MKISAFTFIKNGQILGYPFLQSIQSILTIVDEFIINIGESEDDTLMMIQSLASPKIRIINLIGMIQCKIEAMFMASKK
jgi:hypothetical protein